MNHKLPNNFQPFIESVLSGQTTSIEKKFVPDGKAGDKLRFYSGKACVAVAKISRIEQPTPLNDRWIVFWEPESFQLTK